MGLRRALNIILHDGDYTGVDSAGEVFRVVEALVRLNSLTFGMSTDTSNGSEDEEGVLRQVVKLLGLESVGAAHAHADDVSANSDAATDNDADPNSGDASANINAIPHTTANIESRTAVEILRDYFTTTPSVPLYISKAHREATKEGSRLRRDRIVCALYSRLLTYVLHRANEAMAYRQQPAVEAATLTATVQR